MQSQPKGVQASRSSQGKWRSSLRRRNRLNSFQAVLHGLACQDYYPEMKPFALLPNLPHLSDHSNHLARPMCRLMWWRTFREPSTPKASLANRYSPSSSHTIRDLHDVKSPPSQEHQIPQTPCAELCGSRVQCFSATISSPGERKQTAEPTDRCHVPISANLSSWLSYPPQPTEVSPQKWKAWVLSVDFGLVKKRSEQGNVKSANHYK